MKDFKIIYESHPDFAGARIHFTRFCSFNNKRFKIVYDKNASAFMRVYVRINDGSFALIADNYDLCFNSIPKDNINDVEYHAVWLDTVLSEVYALIENLYG